MLKNNKYGDKMDTVAIIELISKQLTTALNELEKTKSVEEKVLQSKIVKNLSQSLNVFLNMPCGYQPNDIDDEDVDEINNVINDKFAL